MRRALVAGRFARQGCEVCGSPAVDAHHACYAAPLLTRLKLTAVRDQLDSLLDEAVRGEMTLRDALAFLCQREIARKDQRRIDMSFGLAKFPFVRDLSGFNYAAQPSIDRAQIRATSPPAASSPMATHSCCSDPLGWARPILL